MNKNDWFIGASDLTLELADRVRRNKKYGIVTTPNWVDLFCSSCNVVYEETILSPKGLEVLLVTPEDVVAGVGYFYERGKMKFSPVYQTENPKYTDVKTGFKSGDPIRMFIYGFEVGYKYIDPRSQNCAIHDGPILYPGCYAQYEIVEIIVGE